MTRVAVIACGALFLFTLATAVSAQQTGTPVYGSWDKVEFVTYDAKTQCHGGQGKLPLGTLIKNSVFQTNMHDTSCGTIPPKSSIGEHVHRKMEEMFVILNTTAEFTVDGKTSLLPARSMVVCNEYHTHGVYNPHDDIALDWLYFSCTDEKGKGEAVDFGEDLTNKRLESPAPFKYTMLDKSLLKPTPNAHGGKGTIMYRRMWDRDDFYTNWEFVDHCLLPPGTSIGYHQHNSIEEVYFVVSGSGRVTVNDHTWDVKAGDAIPCTLRDSHGIYNNGPGDLELLVNACAVQKGAPDDTKNLGNDLSTR